MIKKTALLCLYFFLFFIASVSKNEVSAISLQSSITSAVTYDPGYGRYGDNLVAYLHAKWVSYRYHIPLLYKPFSYSTDLKLHEKELSYDEHRRRFKNVVLLGRGNQIPIRADNETLYVVPYYPEYLQEQVDGNWLGFIKYLGVDWEDEAFIAYLKEFVQPRFPLIYPSVPTDKITVAIHVRRGGSFNHEAADWQFPHKFSPDSFCIEALRQVDDLLGHRSLYVFIFTDDQHPEIIAQTYEQALGRKNIKFDYHTLGSDHNINVLEDFFTMPLYDCLIHPDSNFTICVAKLHRFMIRVALGDVCVTDRKVKASSINVFLDKNSLGKKIGFDTPLFSLPDTFDVSI